MAEAQPTCYYLSPCKRPNKAGCAHPCQPYLGCATSLALHETAEIRVSTLPRSLKIRRTSSAFLPEGMVRSSLIMHGACRRYSPSQISYSLALFLTLICFTSPDLKTKFGSSTVCWACSLRSSQLRHRRWWLVCAK